MVTEQRSAIEKLPPQNIDAEKALLGAMLLDKHVLDDVADMLPDSSTFYSHAHQAIYEQIVKLWKDGKAVDFVTVTEGLRNEGELEAVGGDEYIVSLPACVTSSAHALDHAKIVRDKSVLRQLINLSTHALTEAYTSSEPCDTVLDTAMANLFELAEDRHGSDSSSVGEIGRVVLDRLDEIANSNGGMLGLPTGFCDLDHILGGLRPELIILGARPSMGKSTLMLNMANHLAIDNDIPVAIFSLEMSKESLTTNLFSQLARVNGHSLRKGDLAESEWPKLTRVMGILNEAPLHIDDTPAITPMALRAKARRLKAKHDIKIIFVDYLQLMRGGEKSESRQVEVSKISSSLKALSRELDIPVVALSQLNRNVEGRADPTPVLSDLRESGAIEQDADVVMFIHRDDYYDKEERPGMARVIVAKQRNGPTGDVDLVFLRKLLRFQSIKKPWQQV